MTVTALSGPSYLIPLNSLTVLALLVGFGLYARGLGGRSEWMVPAGLVVGVLVGVAASILGLQVPRPGLILSILVVAGGLLAALAPRCPDMVAMTGGGIVGAVAGVAGLVPTPNGPFDGVALAVGLIVAAAAGIGLAAILSQGVSWRAVRGLGLVIVAYGSFLLFVTT